MNVLRLSFVLIGAAAVAACAGPQVRSLGNGGGPPAYELRGSSPAAIDAEAGKLCARGYEVLRQGASFARPEPDDNVGTPMPAAGGRLAVGHAAQTRRRPPSSAEAE